MPHIVLEGKLDFELIHTLFEKAILKFETDNSLIKFEDSFLSHSKDIILIETIVIENATSQRYYIQLLKKESKPLHQKSLLQITIRLDPLTDPKNKSDLIKRSLVYIAKKVMINYKESDILITKTNLQEFLK